MARGGGGGPRGGSGGSRGRGISRNLNSYLSGRSGGSRSGNDGRGLYAKGLGTARTTKKTPRRSGINLGRIREDTFRYEDQPKFRVKSPGARKGQEGQTNYLTIKKARPGRGGTKSASFKTLIMGKKKRSSRYADNPNAYGEIWY